MTGALTSGLMPPAIRKVVDPRASDSRANLGRIAMSHISGRAGWWKPPSPVLVRASGEQSPGATRQSSLARTIPTDRILTYRYDTTLVGRGRRAEPTG